MKNYMYYGEIVASISAHLHRNSDDMSDILSTLKNQKDDTYTLHSLSAEAARVFEMAEDLCEEYFIDWQLAIEAYASKIKSALLNGEAPGLIDLYFLCAKTIEEPYRKSCEAKKY